MNFRQKLGTESFKEGNFFYELHENLIFHDALYNKLINDILLYNKYIRSDANIDKNIIKNLYSCMNLIGGIEKMYNEDQIQVEGITSDKLYEYNEELTILIYSLLT